MDKIHERNYKHEYPAFRIFEALDTREVITKYANPDSTRLYSQLDWLEYEYKLKAMGIINKDEQKTNGV